MRENHDAISSYNSRLSNHSRMKNFLTTAALSYLLIIVCLVMLLAILIINKRTL